MKKETMINLHNVCFVKNTFLKESFDIKWGWEYKLNTCTTVMNFTTIPHVIFSTLFSIILAISAIGLQGPNLQRYKSLGYHDNKSTTYFNCIIYKLANLWTNKIHNDLCLDFIQWKDWLQCWMRIVPLLQRCWPQIHNLKKNIIL